MKLQAIASYQHFLNYLAYKLSLKTNVFEINI